MQIMVVSQDSIRNAIEAREKEFWEKKHSLSMKAIRRMLEVDLGIKKNGLDKEKQYIEEIVLKIISSDKPPKSRTTEEESDANESAGDSGNEEFDSEAASGSASDAEVEENEEGESSPEHLPNPKSNSKRKRALPSDEEEEEKSKENGSKRGKSKQTKPVTTKPAYGKAVENLKSILQSCGIRIPPNIYRKAKESPEGKRDAVLIAELKRILEKEGLSENPTEKEIKSVKQRLKKQKELEGIDLGNVINEPRGTRSRRASYVVPKYNLSDESESEDEEDLSEGEEDEVTSEEE